MRFLKCREIIVEEEVGTSVAWERSGTGGAVQYCTVWNKYKVRKSWDQEVLGKGAMIQVLGKMGVGSIALWENPKKRKSRHLV